MCVSVLSLPNPLISQNSFDWYSVLGGAVGALIILGVERVWDWYSNRRKSSKERLHITKAFEKEIEDNLDITEVIIKQLKIVHHSVINFARFNYLWLEKFNTTLIDYANEDSVRLYSFTYGARSLMQQIEDIGRSQHLLSASSRALGSFEILAKNNNQGMLKLAQELKILLKALKSIRTDNYILKEDVDKFLNQHKIKVVVV